MSSSTNWWTWLAPCPWLPWCQCNWTKLMAAATIPSAWKDNSHLPEIEYEVRLIKLAAWISPSLRRLRPTKKVATCWNWWACRLLKSNREDNIHGKEKSMRLNVKEGNAWKLVAKYAKLRAELKAKGDYEALSQLPANASPVRLHNLQNNWPSSRSYMRKFGICCITFVNWLIKVRSLALKRPASNTYSMEGGFRLAAMTDPIADMLTRIRNANSAYHEK